MNARTNQKEDFAMDVRPLVWQSTAESVYKSVSSFDR